MIPQFKKCFIIAEAGVNHNGKLALAKKLIDAAKASGADAVKFQTFHTEDLVTAKTSMASYQKKNTGKTESQLKMLKKLELSEKDFRALERYARQKKITFMSTPHTISAVEFLSPLVSVFKVASGDLTNIPLLQKMARHKKLMIISTGMANMQEIKEAVAAVRPFHKKIVLLHCTSNYPTPFGQVNLQAMLTLKKAFGFPVGYSDHTEGIEIALAAVALGAEVIEKHFTLHRNLPGPDHKASLEPTELRRMVQGIRNIEMAQGNGTKKPFASELAVAKVARKSVVAAKDIAKGERITENMLAIKRPGTGIEPKYTLSIIGKKAKRNIKNNSLLSWQDI